MDEAADEGAAQYERLRAFLGRPEQRQNAPPAAAASAEEGGHGDDAAAQWERLQAFLGRPEQSQMVRCPEKPAAQKEEYELHFEAVCPQASDGKYYLNARTPQQAEACAAIAKQTAEQPARSTANAAGAQKRKRRPAFVPPRTIRRSVQAPLVKVKPAAPKTAVQLAPNPSVDKSLAELLRKLLLQSKEADEHTSTAVLFHTFQNNGCDAAMAFFNAVKEDPRAGALDLYSTCLSCLLITGAHDDVALRVALELRSHSSLELDENAAQLVLAAMLRCRPPPPELYHSLETLVVDGLLTTASPTDVCNAALYAIARCGGTAKELWRIWELMRTEDIEADLHSYLCAIEMCKTDKDGHRCASLCSEMATLGLDVAQARPALLQLSATCYGMWREAVETFEKMTAHEPVLPEMLHLLVQAASNDAAAGSREVTAIVLGAWIDGCEVVAGTLELLVKTLSQQGHIDLALETLEEIHQHDQQTDASSLGSGLQISGISSAQSSSRVYAALLSGCVTTQNTKGARNVIDAMRSHGVWDSTVAAISSCKGSSDSDILSALAPILARSGSAGEE